MTKYTTDIPSMQRMTTASIFIFAAGMSAADAADELQLTDHEYALAERVSQLIEQLAADALSDEIESLTKCPSCRTDEIETGTLFPPLADRPTDILECANCDFNIVL